jgi:hypothetical protein
VVVLLGIVSENNVKRVEELKTSWMIPAAYASALAFFLTIYYFGHAALYGTSVT